MLVKLGSVIVWWVLITIPATGITPNQKAHAQVEGPMTAAQYQSRFGDPNNGVNPAGGFSNQLAAQSAANKYNANPGQFGVNAPGIAPGVNAPGLGNPLTGINAVGDFFQRLTQPATWIRVGEFVAGGLLLFIALNAMTRGPVRSATGKTVKSGVRVAKKVIEK
jgi:hypothetical protein